MHNITQKLIGVDSLDLKEKARQLPAVPGVYIMKDASNNVIYVGKSKKLKSRVSSYFINSKHHSPKVVKLVKNIRDFEYIVTDTEFEAFLLECKLIRSIKPMYNKLMKSPESYVYIKISIMDEYPSISICGEKLQDNCLYFGPYTNHNTVERAVEGIKKSCRIQCSNSIGLRKPSLCLNYSLGLCMGMCGGHGVKDEYNKAVGSIVNLLKGDDERILDDFKTKMESASEKLDFSEAAKYRDYISAINYLIKKQEVVRYYGRNRNIVVTEQLMDKTMKIYFIKGSKVIYKEKLNIDEYNFEVTKDSIKERILTCFAEIPKKELGEINKERIDEAQIVYSYLKNNKDCRYTVIPEVWIAKKEGNKLQRAVDKIFF